MRRKRRLGRPVDKKGRSKGDGQYALLPYALLHSPAWRSLSGAAVKVFLELRTRFHGTNNGGLILSLDEAARLLPIGKATVMRALVELQQKGLIVCTRKGQWYGRLASTWAVSDLRIGDALATNAWRAWQPSLALAKHPRKTERGSRMKPSQAVVGSGMEREAADGSTSEPVRPIQRAAIGSGMGR
jgi:hypothetical protein